MLKDMEHSKKTLEEELQKTSEVRGQPVETRSVSSYIFITVGCERGRWGQSCMEIIFVVKLINLSLLIMAAVV